MSGRDKGTLLDAIIYAITDFAPSIQEAAYPRAYWGCRKPTLCIQASVDPQHRLQIAAALNATFLSTNGLKRTFGHEGD